MKKSHRVALVILIAVVAVVAVLTRFESRHITLQLVGTAGTPFRGIYELDGIPHTTFGELPSTLRFDVKRSMTFQIYKDSKDGELAAAFTSSGGSSGYSATHAPFGGVSGGITALASFFPETCATAMLQPLQK